MAGGGEGHIPASASIAEKARGRLLCSKGRAQTPPLSRVPFALVFKVFPAFSGCVQVALETRNY